MRPFAIPALLLLLATCAATPTLHAQSREVQRCTTLDGTTVFTDRRCEDIGAIDRLPRRTAPAERGLPRGYARGCPRTLADLVQEITQAVDARDVNRLAGVYLWTGISNAAARSILDRLETVVQRPLLDIEAIRPPPPPVLDADGRVVDANADGYYPRTSGRQRPTGLRLQQTLGDGTTPSRTEFGLRRSHGCYWIGG